eukprot:CAMPEP_0183478850 /NCGR_PEP_ID=MMETSP0370-20130417/170644_1 /TAXON_ID=268820 /ORGANISM="Peridinium aciculiferum, Strain PAER-2" /LENGTH=48 /DNA_ID= /DNA_START= /DNA_END= /DNA_ORIENTATION=
MRSITHGVGSPTAAAGAAPTLLSTQPQVVKAATAEQTPARAQTPAPAR